MHKVEQAAQVPIIKLKKTIGIKLPKEEGAKQHIKTKRKASTPISAIENPIATGTKLPMWNNHLKKIILIGTSTGGPRALQEVITKIPKTVEAPILIVQHMPAGFTKSLASRLDQLSEIHVKEAEHGDILKNGTAYVAPGGFHMKLKKVGSTFAIFLDEEEPPRSGHRPSVDVMFESVSQFNDFDKIAVIMTGMGYDGSKGLVQLKNTGNVISIAESQQTCIVYGMPKAAIETHLVDEIVDVDDIAQTIMKYLPKKGGL